MKNKIISPIATLDEITINNITIKKGTEVFYARIIPRVGICYVQTLVVRTIYDTSFVAIDTVTKTAQFISNTLLGDRVFLKRSEASKVVKDAQKSGTIRKFKSEEEEVIDDKNGEV